MHVSGSIEPITLISGYHWKDLLLLQNLQIKVMMSELKQRPKLPMAGYSQHRSQWVKPC